MSITPDKSILSSVPQDAINIIKECLVETREVCPLKLTVCCVNYFITKYKDGYQVSKVLSLKKFERSNRTDTAEEKEITCNIIQKNIKKHYPIFIDEEDDVINYFYTLYYDEYDDDNDDPDDTCCVTISVSSSKTHCNERDFKRKLRLYMKNIGKIFKKKQ